MKRFPCTLACLLVLAGTACSRDPYVRGIGGDIRWMGVPQGQLKTEIYGTGSHSENPVLVVVLHGDGGTAPPRPSYQYAVAQAIAEGFDKPEMPEGLRQSMGPPLRFDDVVAAGILRPGYTDQDGDQSDGRLGNRTGDNHTRQVTEAVVAVVNTLKKDFNARAVILMGHSGGATISANILALYPDTADAALLVACGCDMAVIRARYYDRTGNPEWSTRTPSLDPMTSAHEVPAGKKVRLVVGENDDIVYPEDIRRYADVLAANGVDVEMVVAPGREHNLIFVAPLVFSYLDELVRAY
jgi:pimeloyl-ACP methyl ester carboxylesterase